MTNRNESQPIGGLVSLSVLAVPACCFCSLIAAGIANVDKAMALLVAWAGMIL